MDQNKISVKHEIREVEVSCLMPWHRNPREIDVQAFDGLQYSLEKFGLAEVLVINKKDLRVISGHQRLKSLKALGVNNVTCLVVDFTDQEADLASLTMNNQSIRGVWTKEVLSLLAEIEQRIGPEFEKLGFDRMKSSISWLDVAGVSDQFSRLTEDLASSSELIECPKCKKQFDPTLGSHENAN